MIKILHTESSLAWGGQEIRIIKETLGMLKRGYQVTIAAPENSTIYAKAKQMGIPHIPATFNKKDPFSILRMKQIFSKKRIDILNTHSSSDSWISSIAAVLSKKRPKIIRTRHLSTPISRSVTSRLIYNVFPDVVVTTGEAIRKRMIEWNGFDPSRIFSIPTGIDLDLFNPAKVQPSVARKGFLIGTVSVLRSWKGHRYLIEAMPYILKYIPDGHLIITGTGPIYENIKQLIRQSSLEKNVTMLGHREDIPEILASIDILVHPSYANEGVPQTILQALAMGKPVVASDTGGIGEIIIDGTTGLLVEPRNPPAIAEGIIYLYRNRKLMSEFALAGRRLVEKKYSFDHMLDSMESIYAMLQEGAR